MTNTPDTPRYPPPKKSELLSWGATTAALLLFLLLLYVFSLVLAGRSSLDAEGYIERFVNILGYVKEYYVDEEAVDTRDLVEGALKGMIDSLEDPYSYYLTAEEMKTLQETTSGQFGGIGVVIGETRKGIEVSRPIRGTPAFKAGILSGDVIVAVDGLSILDLGLDEAVELIRGEPQTEVVLTIRRGEGEWEVTLQRDVIETSSVERGMIGKGIGYLRILSFYVPTLEQVGDSLGYFDDAEYRGLIVDLRSNPGGLLDSVVDVADLFLDRGTTVVSTKARVLALNRVYRAQNAATVPSEIPIIVLTDRYSASAAEILTGALKDTGRAVVAGETTYGKGSVQEILPRGEGGVKLTTSFYLTPSGTIIDEIGIAPDVEIREPELTEEEKESYRKLLESSRIEEFLDGNPDLEEEGILRFLGELEADGFEVPERLVREYVQDSYNRRNRIYPIYDLEYDTVLQRTVALMEELLSDAER